MASLKSKVIECCGANIRNETNHPRALFAEIEALVSFDSTGTLSLPPNDDVVCMTVGTQYMQAPLNSYRYAYIDIYVV